MGVRLLVDRAGLAEDSGEPSTAESSWVFEFDQSRVVIGRDVGVDVRLPSPAVSGKHATIRSEGAGYVLQDEGSTNGTTVNGIRLAPRRPKPLKDGDQVVAGEFRLLFSGGVAVAECTTADRTSAFARQMLRRILDGADGTPRPTPRLLVLHGPDTGRSLDLPGPPGRFGVGRDPACHLTLEDPDLSRRHAEVRVEDDGVVLVDLDSKNGLRVNDRPVRRRKLHDRDEIRLGDTVLVYEDPTEVVLREVTARPDEVTSVPPPLSIPSPPAVEPGAPPPSETRATRGGRPGRFLPRTDPELVVYVLAGVILTFSVGALVFLLRP